MVTSEGSFNCCSALAGQAGQTGNLLFLTGMLPREGHEAKFVGRVGAELDLDAGSRAAYLAKPFGTTPSPSRVNIWDRSTKSRGLSDSA
jgi:hypothetical protein